MSDSHYFDKSIRTNPDSFFFTQYSNGLVADHKPIKANNVITNFRQRNMIHAAPKFIKVSAGTSKETPFQAGSTVQHKVDFFYGMIVDFYMKLTIRNEDGTNTAKIPSNAAYLFQDVSLHLGGIKIQTISNQALAMHNLFMLNKDTQEIQSNQLGVQLKTNKDLSHVAAVNKKQEDDNDLAYIEIAPNQTMELFFRIPTPLSNQLILREGINGGDLIIKSTYNSQVECSGDVQNSNLKVLNDDIYVQKIDIPTTLTVNILKNQLTNYQCNSIQVHEEQVTNLEKNVPFTIDLKSYKSFAFGILACIKNDAHKATDDEKMYPIQSIELLDSTSQSIQGGIKYDKTINKLHITQHFQSNPWFYKNQDKMFILPYCLNMTNSINENAVNGSTLDFGKKEYKMQITPDVTLDGKFQVVLYYITSSYLKQFRTESKTTLELEGIV